MNGVRLFAHFLLVFLVSFARLLFHPCYFIHLPIYFVFILDVRTRPQQPPDLDSHPTSDPTNRPTNHPPAQSTAHLSIGHSYQPFSFTLASRPKLACCNAVFLIGLCINSAQVTSVIKKLSIQERCHIFSLVCSTLVYF